MRAHTNTCCCCCGGNNIHTPAVVAVVAGEDPRAGLWVARALMAEYQIYYLIYYYEYLICYFRAVWLRRFAPKTSVKSLTVRASNAWHAALLRCQYLYFCTSKARKHCAMRCFCGATQLLRCQYWYFCTSNAINGDAEMGKDRDSSESQSVQDLGFRVQGLDFRV